MATIYTGAKTSYAQGTQTLLSQSNMAANRSKVGSYDERVFRNQEKPEGSETWDTITKTKADEVKNNATTKKVPAADKNVESEIEKQRKINSLKPLSAIVPASVGTSSDVVNVVLRTEITKEPYPLDIVKSGYFLHIMLAPYDADVALAGGGVQHNASFALPIPSNLLTATSLDYTNINLGAFGGEFLKSAVRLGQSAERGDLLGQVRQEVNTAMQALFNKDDNSVRQLVARRILSGVSPQLGSAVDLAAGNTPNPHVAVTFNNVKLRSFTYTWKFSPNSKEESVQLQSIIQTLHQRILPKKKGNLLLEYPNQCQLEFLPSQLNSLFKFKPCVIDSMNVNYAPSGVPSFFAGTKLPTEVELSMTFHEIQIRTSEDYNNTSSAGAN